MGFLDKMMNIAKEVGDAKKALQDPKVQEAVQTHIYDELNKAGVNVDANGNVVSLNTEVEDIERYPIKETYHYYKGYCYSFEINDSFEEDRSGGDAWGEHTYGGPQENYDGLNWDGRPMFAILNDFLSETDRRDMFDVAKQVAEGTPDSKFKWCKKVSKGITLFQGECEYYKDICLFYGFKGSGGIDMLATIRIRKNSSNKDKDNMWKVLDRVAETLKVEID